MKVLGQGISLALVAAGLAAAPALAAQAAQAPAAPAAAQPSLVQKMKAAAEGSVRFSKEDATGKVDFVKAGRNGDLLPTSEAAPTQKADAYLAKFAPAFGASSEQLVRDDVAKSQYGSVVTYVQEYKGIPVFGSLLRVHFDDQGALTGVNGEVVPTAGLSTATRISAAEAGTRAVQLVRAQPPGEDGRADTTGIKAKASTLEVYRHGLTKGEAGGDTELVYQVEVTNEKNVRDMVFLSATSGKLVNRYSMIHDALEREIFEQSYSEATKVFDEGDGDDPATLNVDQRNIYEGTGEAYWFFRNTFNRDSYDGAGHKMQIVNNDPRIACPNANWNGVTTNYCNGVTSDDVVAHEWGHAYTEYTHGLIYQWQSGALNESYSDVWGETIDLINKRQDEGEGDLNAKRPVGLCSKFTRGAIGVTINAPAAIAGPCDAAEAASFGPVFDQDGVTSDLVIGTDAANPTGPSTTDGCTAFTNAAAINGKFVYVDRGTCPFAAKIANAENAGATGIIFGNNNPGALVSVAGVSDLYGAMVTQADGTRIKSAVGTINITVTDIDTDEKANSYRWLVSEKSPAFGGAIRDMWNPTCYGDPGKVSDAEYHCTTDDSGGVHSNSGVPNHGYSLLVDGGTFNGSTVEGIGLTKAAAIYFKAMNEYQTPVSDFTDHADSLEAACGDLIGKQLRKLSVLPNDSSAYDKKITTEDCTQVTAMIAAVELRTDPTVQCDFQPQLDPNAPALCGDGTESVVAFEDDFEAGIGNWTLDGESVFGGPTADWETTTELPEGNKPVGSETAAFGPAPDRGACNGDASDFSSVNTMTSPEIELDDTGLSPRVSFDHNIQTELGFDGGNLQVSVNGGDFEPVPAEAYTFNGPTVLATEAAGSTNPLAGQPGFTGSDGGRIESDWGTSQVDLEAIGVQAGDTIQLQYAIGRDGCGGVNGWWVDNVQVVLCEDATNLTMTATHEPEPSTYGEASDLVVTVEGPDGEDAPTGDVTASIQGTEVGEGTLTGDPATATLELPADLPAGTHQVFIRYEGDGTYDALTRSTTITIDGAATTVEAVRTPASTQYRQPSSLDVTVAPEGDLEEVPTGEVEVTDGANVIASGELDEDGAATIALPSNLTAGAHALTVTYVGEGNFAEGSTNVSAPVTKATTTTVATGRPNPVVRNATITARAVVDQAFGTSTGVVEIWTGGVRVARGTLANGVVNIPITKNFAVGQRTFSVRYLGTANIKPSSDTFTVRIVNAKVKTNR